jgi:hypothetical protein
VCAYIRIIEIRLLDRSRSSSAFSSASPTISDIYHFLSLSRRCQWHVEHLISSQAEVHKITAALEPSHPCQTCSTVGTPWHTTGASPCPTSESFRTTSRSYSPVALLMARSLMCADSIVYVRYYLDDVYEAYLTWHDAAVLLHGIHSTHQQRMRCANLFIAFFAWRCAGWHAHIPDALNTRIWNSALRSPRGGVCRLSRNSHGPPDPTPVTPLVGPSADSHAWFPSRRELLHYLQYLSLASLAQSQVVSAETFKGIPMRDIFDTLSAEIFGVEKDLQVRRVE